MRSRGISIPTALFCLLSTACGNRGFAVGLSPPPPPPPPTIGVTAAPGAVTLARGQSAAVVVSVTRLNYDLLNIDLTAEALPAGVTAVFVPASLPFGAPTSTLTLSAAVGAALGQTAITIRASGASVTSKTAPVSLTVIP